MIYLSVITLGLCLLYFALFFIYPLFFEKEIEKIGKKAIFSVLLIAILSLISYTVVFNIPNEVLANRVLHGFGGGFMAFLVCFLVVRDGKLSINKFQFFMFAALLVTALGVTNEIVECILQNYVGMVAATSINDTWLDLISNTTGLLIASLFLVPFIKPKIGSEKVFIK